MMQTGCGVWADTVLDLKEDRQGMLQKSFMVPFMSTAAMMRCRGCVIALTEPGGGPINKEDVTISTFKGGMSSQVTKSFAS